MSFKEIVDKYESTPTVHLKQDTSFATYQDMIDCQCVIENYDYESHSDSDSEEESSDLDEIKSNLFAIANEDEDADDDIDTINIIDELFKYCKKLRRSHRVLKREVRELKEKVEILNTRLAEKS